MLLAMLPDEAPYQLVLFLHVLFAIVGFGSTFVWPYLAAKGRAAGPPASLEFARASTEGGKLLSSYPIYGVGVTGVLLVILGDEFWVQFSDTWISIAFFLYAVALGVSLGLHLPNLKAMLGLQEEMAAGPPPAGGPPPQVAELQERGKRAGMYGGILHLLFVLILLDMVFKPGSSGAI